MHSYDYMISYTILDTLHYQMEASPLYWSTHTLPDGGEPPTGHGSGALHPLTQYLHMKHDGSNILNMIFIL